MNFLLKALLVVSWNDEGLRETKLHPPFHIYRFNADARLSEVFIAKSWIEAVEETVSFCLYFIQVHN